MKDKGMVADLSLLSCGLDYSKGYTNELRAYVDYAIVKFRNQPNLFTNWPTNTTTRVSRAA
jgi:hypothetical protein